MRNRTNPNWVIALCIALGLSLVAVACSENKPAKTPPSFRLSTAHPSHAASGNPYVPVCSDPRADGGVRDSQQRFFERVRQQFVQPFQKYEDGQWRLIISAPTGSKYYSMVMRYDPITCKFSMLLPQSKLQGKLPSIRTRQGRLRLTTSVKFTEATPQLIDTGHFSLTYHTELGEGDPPQKGTCATTIVPYIGVSVDGATEVRLFCPHK